jgi:hypothetical protein
MNWYIGQEIVAIVDHHQGFFIKGQEFLIKGIVFGICKCNMYSLDIGIPNPYHGMQKCSTCGTPEFNTGALNILFIDKHFAPKQSTYSEAEIEAVNVDELVEIVTEPEYASI